VSPEKRDPAVEQYILRLASIGGKARAEALTPRQRKRIAKQGGKALQAGRTPEERSASARKAARARWGAKRKKA